MAGAYDSDAFDTDAYSDQAHDFGSVVASGFFATEGTLVDENGVVQIEYVAWNHTLLASDVYILGTLHRGDGAMYCTTDATGNTGDVFINGIRHSIIGVRYVDSVVANEASISKGFISHEDDGQQTVTTTVAGEIDHGILRSSDQEMVIAENP